MEASDVESRVSTVMAKVFQLSPEQTSDHLRMGNPPEWDSFGHVQLLFAIEEEFGIRFPTHEMTGLVTTESIVGAVWTIIDAEEKKTVRFARDSHRDESSK